MVEGRPQSKSDEGKPNSTGFRIISARAANTKLAGLKQCE